MRTFSHNAGLLLLVSLVIYGCSRNYSTARDETSGRQRIYGVSDDEAVAIAHTAIVRSFPGRRIEEITGPTRGYSTYTRFGLDTFTQQVLIHSVTGLTLAGATVDGYTFEVSVSGTSGSGAIRNGSFFSLLQDTLDKSGKAVEVVSSRPRLIAKAPVGSNVDDSIQQLQRLKLLLDQNAIIAQDYNQKKAELLGRM